MLRLDPIPPVIAESQLRRLAADERGMMSCVLLARPDSVLSLMTGVPGADEISSRRRQQNAPGQDRSGIWLRNAAAGLCLLAAAAAVVSFTAQYRLIYTTRQLAIVAALEAAISCRSTKISTSFEAPLRASSVTQANNRTISR